jgi:hypothetical protein
LGEHTPACNGLLQDCPGGQEASAQQTSSTQFPELQSDESSHALPFGLPVPVDVTVGVLVGVGVSVEVDVAVAVLVEVTVGVLVGVCVGVEVCVAVGVLVGVSVGVAEGAVPAHVPWQAPNPVAVWRHKSFEPVQPLSVTTAAQLSPKQHVNSLKPEFEQTVAH